MELYECLGLVVFVNDKKRYMFQEVYHSRPSRIGEGIIKQLVLLFRQFDGDILKACKYWGHLLAAYSTITDRKFQRKNCYDSGLENFQKIFNDPTHGPPLVTDIFQQLTRSLNYIYIIDLDSGMFSIENYKLYRGTKLTWSFISLYFMLIKLPHLHYKHLKLWLADVQSLRRDELDNVLYSREYETAHLNFRAVEIQSHARRYITMKRELEPDVGRLYLLAKKRFERSV